MHSFIFFRFASSSRAALRSRRSSDCWYRRSAAMALTSGSTFFCLGRFGDAAASACCDAAAMAAALALARWRTSDCTDLTPCSRRSSLVCPRALAIATERGLSFGTERRRF